MSSSQQESRSLQNPVLDAGPLVSIWWIHLTALWTLSDFKKLKLVNCSGTSYVQCFCQFSWVPALPESLITTAWMLNPSSSTCMRVFGHTDFSSLPRVPPVILLHEPFTFWQPLVTYSGPGITLHSSSAPEKDNIIAVRAYPSVWLYVLLYEWFVCSLYSILHRSLVPRSKSAPVFKST